MACLYVTSKDHNGNKCLYFLVSSLYLNVHLYVHLMYVQLVQGRFLCSLNQSINMDAFMQPGIRVKYRPYLHNALALIISGCYLTACR